MRALLLLAYGRCCRATHVHDECWSGYLCNSTDTLPCPAGFWCDDEASPEHAACAANASVQAVREEIAQSMSSANDTACPCLDTCGSTPRVDGKLCYCPVGLCPAGFICHAGTPAATRYGNPCPEGYYCPEGTSPSNLEAHQCPTHTSSNPGSQSLFECYRSSYAIVAEVSGAALFGTEQWAALGSAADDQGWLSISAPARITINLTLHELLGAAQYSLLYGGHWRLAIYAEGEGAEPVATGYGYGGRSELELGYLSLPSLGPFAFELMPRDELLPLRVRPVVQILHGLFADDIAAFASSGSIETPIIPGAWSGRESAFVVSHQPAGSDVALEP